MKGLPKKNNKTRGKTNRRKKNNRKTIRKRNKRGGAGLQDIANEKPLLQQKDELINELKSHEEAYKSKVEENNEIFKKLNTELNTILDIYKNMSPKNNNGSTEAKNDDENTQPNIKKRTDIKAEFIQKKKERDSKKDKLQREINEEHTKLNTKRKEIQDKLTEIEKDIQLAKERQMIEDENYEKAMERAKKLNLIYLPPHDPNEGIHVSQVKELEKDEAELAEHDYTIFEKANEMGIITIGGKKRKTYKKRK
jgi:hypothetical protein